MSSNQERKATQQPQRAVPPDRRPTIDWARADGEVTLFPKANPGRQRWITIDADYAIPAGECQ